MRSYIYLMLAGIFVFCCSGVGRCVANDKPLIPGMTPDGKPVQIWLGTLKRSEVASVAEVCREAVQAVLQRRPQQVPQGVSGDVLLADNGISIVVVRNGKVLASGSGVGQKLPENARLAAGESVYGLEIPDFSRVQIAVSVLGKPQRQPEGTAPFYKFKPGAEGYMIEYAGKKAVLGPVYCVINQLDWRGVLLKLAKMVAPKKDKPYTKSELIKFMAKPDFVLSVMPAYNVLSPGDGLPAELLELSAPAGGGRVSREICQRSLELVKRWLKSNQGTSGGFSGQFDLVAGISGGVAGAFGDLCGAYAIGSFWQMQKSTAVRFQGRRVLDKVLMDWYLDSPGQDFGYIKQKGEVNIATAAMALLAIDTLYDKQDRGAVARYQDKLRKFLDVMYKQDGAFRPWFEPAKRKTSSNRFSAMAVYALSRCADKKYAEDFVGIYQTLPKAEITKSPLYACWMILGACESYARTRQSAAASWAFEAASLLGEANDEILKQAADKKLSPQVCGLLLRAYCETLYLQKLQLGTGGVREESRLLKLRKSAVRCLGELVSLQIRPGGQSLLLKSPQVALGAFCVAPGDMRATVEGNFLALGGLVRACEVLEKADYDAVK